MRCLSLAEHLRKNGCDVRFICRDHEGNLVDYIQSKGYQTHKLITPSSERIGQYQESPLYHASWLVVPWQMDAEQTIAHLQDESEPIDWLIIDHYAIDAAYEAAIRPYVSKIMVIDDLADRKHDCDLLLDQNYDNTSKNKYINLVPQACAIFVGPDYALLREEFRIARGAMKRRDGRIRAVLVSFGGVDITGETIKVLQALLPLVMKGLKLEVILGKMNPNTAAIIAFCRQMPHCRYYEHVENMTALMAEADLAIGSGGMTTWERCTLGLPSIVITTAHNQEKSTERVAKIGAIHYLGKSADITPSLIYGKVVQLMNDPPECLDMSSRAYELVDGLGLIRISEELRR
jgi:UDP-2,4-diacetamido-2,4,6-trideoxy-beta-L-altropyranose hydrolase